MVSKDAFCRYHLMGNFDIEYYATKSLKLNSQVTGR